MCLCEEIGSTKQKCKWFGIQVKSAVQLPSLPKLFKTLRASLEDSGSGDLTPTRIHSRKPPIAFRMF